MAIEYKNLKEKSKKGPLTDLELSYVNTLEMYIDKEIKRQYRSSGDKIHIDLIYVNFDYLPGRGKMDLGYDRSSLMRKEIERRYKSAGWKMNVEYDDGLDGPNMSGPDYWILTGK